MKLWKLGMIVALMVAALAQSAFADDVVITGFPGGLQYLLAPLTHEADQNFASFKAIDRLLSSKLGVRIMIPKNFPSEAPPEQRPQVIKMVLDNIVAGNRGLFVTTAPPQKYVDQLAEAGLEFPQGLEVVQIGTWECDLVQGADYQEALLSGKYISKISKAQLSRVLLSPKTILWKEFHVNPVQAAFPVTIGYEKGSGTGYALSRFVGGKKFGPNAVDTSIISDIQQGTGLYGAMVAADHKANGNANGLTVVLHDRAKAGSAVNVVKQTDFALAAPVYVYIAKDADPTVRRVVAYLQKRD